MTTENGGTRKATSKGTAASSAGPSLGLRVSGSGCRGSPGLDTAQEAVVPGAVGSPSDREAPAGRSGRRSTQTLVVSLPFQNVFCVRFRIYNNLPEVKKKKEEQKKRLILQSNRLRAEVFKKVMAWRPTGATCVVRRCGL